MILGVGQRVSVKDLQFYWPILEIAPGDIQHGTGDIASDDFPRGADQICRRLCRGSCPGCDIDIVLDYIPI
jgi:hypothetical protein